MPNIYAMWELFYEDLDPDGTLFTTVHYPDVGCKRGGWGELIMQRYTNEVPKEGKVNIVGSK